MLWTGNLVSRNYGQKKKIERAFSTGTWWRHHDVTWHILKTHLPKCYVHQTWSVGARSKKIRALLLIYFLTFMITTIAPGFLNAEVIGQGRCKSFVAENVTGDSSTWETPKKKELPIFINNSKTVKVKIDNIEVQVWSAIYHLTLNICFSLIYCEGSIVYYCLSTAR